jgi:preprotein translocase subunit SecB
MKLDPSIYQELINNIEIETVNLKDLTVKRANYNNDQKNIEISVKHGICSYQRVGDIFSVEIKFNIEGVTEEEKVLSIEFILELIYEIDSSYAFEEDYFELFTTNNVPVNAWPYARELVSNLTLRMGLAALVLPVLKVK